MGELFKIMGRERGIKVRRSTSEIVGGGRVVVQLGYFDPTFLGKIWTCGRNAKKRSSENLPNFLPYANQPDEEGTKYLRKYLLFYRER